MLQTSFEHRQDIVQILYSSIISNIRFNEGSIMTILQTLDVAGLDVAERLESSLDLTPPTIDSTSLTCVTGGVMQIWFVSSVVYAILLG